MESPVLDKEFLKSACQARADYSTIVSQTRDALAAYFEGDALRAILLQWPKEEAEKYVWRRERILENYDNFVKQISGLYVEGVFRTKQPERKTGDAAMDEYLQTSYADWFLKSVAPFALFLPELYIVIDMPRAKGSILTKEDALTMQGLPYPVVRFPQYACNFGFDESGALSWITFFTGIPPRLGPNVTVQGEQSRVAPSVQDKKKLTYEIYTTTQYAQFDEDGELLPIAQMNGQAMPFDHSLDFLPVVRVAYQDNYSLVDAQRAGHAMMHTIVQLALGGINMMGLLYDFLYYALYPKLVAGADTINNMIEIGMGANKPIPVANNEKDIRPGYLEVPMKEFEALERQVYERIPERAYRAARLRDRQSVTKATAQSGVSKMFDMVPELGVLQDIAKYLRSIDYATISVMALYAGIPKQNVEVEYPTSFDTKSTSELMAETIAWGDAVAKNSLPTSLKGSVEISQRGYKSILSGINDPAMLQIMEEVEASAKELDTESVEEDEEEVDTTLTTGEPSDTEKPSAGTKV